MRSLTLSLVLLAALPALTGAPGASAAPPAAEAGFPWPAGAAGRVAREYFAMMADGSEAAIRGFEAAFRTREALERTPMDERIRSTQSLREQLGSLTPLAVVRHSAAEAVIGARTVDGDSIELEFVMSSTQPGKLDGIGIVADPAVLTPQRPLGATGRKELVEGVAAAVSDVYVFPEVGRQMAARIRARSASGAYDSISREKAMAARLTEDLRSVADDKHLAVRFSPAEPSQNPSGLAPTGPEAAHDNYGFRKVELLEGNVGYLRLDLFLDDREAKKTADAALAFLGHADAIIVDLRYNAGGDPEMIRHISSYFFDTPTHLNSMMDRDDKIVGDYWTGDVPGKKLPQTLPLYVLTSRSTFSGAEEFAYNLKQLERATIVGETTGGGAHPVRPIRIDDRFVVSVPFLRAVNPITRTNWEGVGVEPDVATPADQALERALELARGARPAPGSAG